MKINREKQCPNEKWIPKHRIVKVNETKEEETLRDLIDLMKEPDYDRFKFEQFLPKDKYFFESSHQFISENKIQTKPKLFQTAKASKNLEYKELIMRCSGKRTFTIIEKTFNQDGKNEKDKVKTKKTIFVCPPPITTTSKHNSNNNNN